MRRYVLLALCLASVSSLAFAAQVSGRWSTSLSGEPVVYTLSTSEGTLQGSITFVNHDYSEAFYGRIEGDSLYFTVEPGGFRLDHRGLVMGDTLFLEVRTGDGTVAVKATRN